MLQSTDPFVWSCGSVKKCKWRSRFFEESSYSKIGVNEAFLGLKSAFLYFSFYMFLRFFWNLPDGRQLLVKIDYFGFLGSILNILVLNILIIYIVTKWGKCRIFGPKINILDFFWSLYFLEFEGKIGYFFDI